MRLGEERDVLPALAQRRHRNGNGADPEVEIVAELPLAHQCGQVLVGGGDQEDVDLAVHHLAHAAEAFLLQHFEHLGLDRGIEVSHLVEEQGAAVRHFEEPFLVADRAGEGAAVVAEELALEELAAETGAVQVDERLARRRAAVAGAASAPGSPLPAAGLALE